MTREQEESIALGIELAQGVVGRFPAVPGSPMDRKLEFWSHLHHNVYDEDFPVEGCRSCLVEESIGMSLGEFEDNITDRMDARKRGITINRSFSHISLCAYHDQPSDQAGKPCVPCEEEGQPVSAHPRRPWS